MKSTHDWMWKNFWVIVLCIITILVAGPVFLILNYKIPAVNNFTADGIGSILHKVATVISILDVYLIMVPFLGTWSDSYQGRHIDHYKEKQVH